MSRRKAKKDYFSFVKGIITEASPLAFPENASVDEENFDLFTDGSRRKRLGVDFETASALRDSSTTDAPSRVFVWDAPGGDGSKQFIVIQELDYLYVYDSYDYTYIGSALVLYISGSTTSEQVNYNYWDMTFGYGYLFAVHPYCYPMMLEYDSSAAAGSQITRHFLTVYTRDFDGIYDGTTITNKPAVLTDQHKYNLLNQGWLSSNVVAYGTPYPSRAMVMSDGKDKSPQSSAGVYDVWTAAVQNLSFPNATPAPTGHFVLPLISKSRSFYLSTDVNNDSTWTIATTWDYNTNTSLSAVGFFAGRVWYSGMNDAGYSGEIYFSQILSGQTYNEAVKSAGACYQQADPTSEYISDLVSSDGGAIKIPDAGNIIRLYPTRNSILCMSNSGVWEISGGQSGFKATDFKIRKITSFGISSKYSVVDVGSSILYCGKDGIIEISPNQYTGELEGQNISQGTIQSLYLEIPLDNRSNILGEYDYHNNKIYWLYFDGDTYPSGTNGTHVLIFNHILVLDLNIKGFYKYSFEHVTSTATSRKELTSSNWNTGPFISGVFIPKYPYTIGNNYNDNQVRHVKVLALYKEGNNWSLYPCLFNNTDFVDWSQVSSGTPVFGFLETGYDTVEDASKKKQVTYLTTYLNRTEQNFVDDGSGNAVFDNPSGCLLTSKWEWADSSTSGRYSKQRQIYRFKRNYAPSGTLPEAFDNGFPIVVVKDKVRGNGRSLVLRFDTEEEKDCWIQGWAIDYTMDGNT